MYVFYNCREAGDLCDNIGLVLVHLPSIAMLLHLACMPYRFPILSPVLFISMHVGDPYIKL